MLVIVTFLSRFAVPFQRRSTHNRSIYFGSRFFRSSLFF